MADRLGSEPKTEYVLGHSQREIRRLMLQAAILRPVTERLLRGSGISQGMRVLEMGCGAGDVAMLVAELVGPSGSVIAIDRSQAVIAVARERARTAKLHHVDFREAPAEVYSDSEPFDAVIGRYVLVHQDDPVAFLRAATSFVRPGGIVAFHEINLHGPSFGSLPGVELWRQTGEWIEMAFRAVTPHGDAGARLIEHFSLGGLPHPNLFCESLVGGGKDSPLYAWATGVLESLVPQLVRMRVVTEDTIAIETLEARLRDAVVEARSQIVTPAQFCAWAKV
jgi:ubiquinone/menaquinone biosynthesis C-methylase UbiE